LRICFYRGERTGEDVTEENRWDPRPGDGERIRQHLERQRDLDILVVVRLDDGRIARVGEDAEGEDE
jgi:hypothetical protein